MQFKHAPAVVSAAFDDPNLVSAMGLEPVLRLVNLGPRAPLLKSSDSEHVFVDVDADADDTIIRAHGYQKHGAGFGYSGVRGLNTLLAVVSTSSSAPVILGQRLRKGQTGSPKGAARILGDALVTLRRMKPEIGSPRVLVRAASTFYGHAGTALRAGADVSVTVRLGPAVRTAITTIKDDACTTIEYTDAIRDEATGRWISKAEVAEIPFTAFRRPTH